MHEIKQFMWALCPDTFHGSKNRQLHEAKMHSVRTILCDQCEKNVFRLEYFMLWRSPNMSYLWKSMYWCPNCEKACTGVLFVKRHVLMKMFKVKYEQTQWPQTLCLWNLWQQLSYKQGLKETPGCSHIATQVSPVWEMFLSQRYSWWSHKEAWWRKTGLQSSLWQLLSWQEEQRQAWEELC